MVPPGSTTVAAAKGHSGASYAREARLRPCALASIDGRHTGGWTYPIQAAERCNEVCLRIADELGNQYLLACYSTNQDRDGRWRSIEVRSSRPGVTLMTRTGYYARS